MAGLLRECSSRYGWDDAAKLLWRRVRLTGRARTTLKRLPEATKVSYEATAVVLTQRFEPDSNREVYRVEFQSRTKVQGEEWADCEYDLRSLADKAYHELQEDAC